MDRNQFEKLGEQLREIGHRRRQLAEQVFQEVKDRDSLTSQQLYQELSEVSNQAIEIISQQKEMFENELQNL